jgi:hypothetical protein
MISKAHFATKDLTLLVAQHHGSPDGEKIPEKVSANISALAHVYIACEDMAYNLLRQPEVPPLSIYKSLEDKYRASVVSNYLSKFPKIFDLI